NERFPISEGDMCACSIHKHLPKNKSIQLLTKQQNNPSED
ncbi:32283_t:CDS:1, partial [Racocetra persica]